MVGKAGPSIEQVAVPRTQPPPPSAANGAAPVPPSRPMALKQRRGWRPGLLLVGLLLVAGSMLGGILLFDSVTTTTTVLVAAQDLERGQVLEVSDVRVAEISLAPDVNVLTLDEQRFLGGEEVGEPVRALKGFVPAGAVLSEDHFIIRSNAMGADEALVGLRLESGEYPSLLKVGDTVEMYSVRGRIDEAAATFLGTAEVWRVWQQVSDVDPTEDLVADLVVKAEIQPAVVQAQAEETLRLTIVSDPQG